MESTIPTPTPLPTRNPQELQAQEILQRVCDSVQSVYDTFEKLTSDTVQQLEFYKYDNDNLLKIKGSNPTVFERRSKENAEICVPLQAEIGRADGLMKRFAEIVEIAAKETVAEFTATGSGLGKFGDFPNPKITVNELKKDEPGLYGNTGSLFQSLESQLQPVGLIASN